MFDTDPRTAEYGAVESMPLAGVAEHLRGLAANGDNAPITKSTADGTPGGQALEQYRYAVIRLRYYEKRGGGPCTIRPHRHSP